MSEKSNTSRPLTYLPRNWRLMTAYGAATVGLACGIVQPALAEWFKAPKSDQAQGWPRAGVVRTPSGAKTAPAQNGFVATIKRLMEDSKHAAERGDYEKAVQLAERAAKISEATAQLLGPSTECSPEQTQAFATDMRARYEAFGRGRDQAGGNRQVLQAGATPPQAAPAQRSAPPAPHSRQPSAKQATDNALARQIAASQANRPMARPATTDTVRKQQPDAKVAWRPTNPAPTQPSAEQLMAQSRTTADNGDIDGAIRLAEQAVAAAHTSTNVFGQGHGRDCSAEASLLLAQLRECRDGVAEETMTAQIPAAEAPVAEPTTADVGVEMEIEVAKAPKRATIFPATPSEADSILPGPDDVAASDQIPTAPASDADAPAAPPATTPPSDVASTAPKESEGAPGWSEELPPAPAPELKKNRGPLRFSRNGFERLNAWNSSELDGPAPPAAEESRAAVEAKPAETDVSKTEDAVPEFPITASKMITRPEVSPSRSDASQDRVPGLESSDAAVAKSDASVIRTEGVVESQPAPPQSGAATRPPLRLRGRVHQAIAESAFDGGSPILPAGEWKAASPKDTSRTTPAPEKKETPRPPAVPIQDSAEGDGDGDGVVQRFPVQKVIQLRQRLEAASSFDPGQYRPNSSGEAARSDTPSRTTIPASSGTESAWEKFVAEEQKAESAAPTVNSSEPRRPAVKLRRNAIQAEPQTTVIPAAATETRRPVIKLRQKDVAAIDTDYGRSSSAVPKRPDSKSQTTVGRTEPVIWKAASSEEESAVAQSSPDSARGASQPALTPPIAQAGFESSDPQPDSLQKTALAEKGSSSPDRSSDAWFKSATSDSEEAPPPPEESDFSNRKSEDSFPEEKREKVADFVVHKSSFNLIDQIAGYFKLPVSTTISLIAGLGMAMFGFGLVLLRAAIRARHSS